MAAEAARTRRYHGFVSYSHAADGTLAPAVQRGLQQLAKPWSKRRALEVFRDDTGLSVNPGLWGSIVAALDDSEWFVLLASPDSARSEWVGKEIAHWVQMGGASRLLPVVTDGTWVWDDAAGEIDFARSSAAHPALRGVFGEEPRHVDLSWARTETDLTLHNARFRDLVADIAAPLHGRSKDDLEGEDVRQQRRTRRLARGAIAALASLTVLATAGGASAVVNAREAGRQRDTARVQARVATAANLADRSAAADRSDLSLKILLALQSFRLDPSAANEAALRTALQTDVTGVLHGPTGGIVDISLDAGGRRAAAVDGAGRVRVWDLGRRALESSSAAGIAAKADWLGDSSLLVSDASGGVSTLALADGSRQKMASDARVLIDATTIVARPVVTANAASGFVAYVRTDGMIAVLGIDGSPKYVFATAPGARVVDAVLASDGRLILRSHVIDVWQLGPAGATRVATAPVRPSTAVGGDEERVELHGGLTLSLDEARVAWAGADEYDASTGEQLSHRQCIPMTDTFLSSANAYVGGTATPVFWDTGFAQGLGSSAGVPGAGCPPGGENFDIETEASEVATGFAAPGGQVWSLAGRADGLLLVGGSSGPVTMLRFGAYSTLTDLPVDELMGVGCLIAGRNLTDSEWTIYLPGATPHQICAVWPPVAEEDESPFVDGGGS